MQMSNALHRKVYEAVNARYFEAIRRLYHDRCSYMTGDGDPQRGVEAVVDAVTEFTSAFPDLEIDIKNQYASSDNRPSCTAASTAMAVTGLLIEAA
jgi:hypothetical protein